MDINEIKRLQKLSALTSSDEKLNELMKDFNEIANFVQEVKDADIDSKTAYTRILKISELRPDEVEPSFSQQDILANAPEKGEGAFVVPKVVD